jgi:hypothetical protein
MTQDEIIEMANKAYAIDGGKPLHPSALFHLEIFAKLVAAKVEEALAEEYMTDIHRAIKIEREACAKVCDDLYRVWTLTDEDDLNPPDALDCKRAIQARSKT